MGLEANKSGLCKGFYGMNYRVLRLGNQSLAAKLSKLLEIKEENCITRQSRIASCKSRIEYW